MNLYFHNADGTVEAVRGQLAHPFSPRELQVAALVASGLSDKNIAYVLGIGLCTARKYILTARIKCKAPNKAGLAAAYSRLFPGPPSPPPPAAAAVRTITARQFINAMGRAA